MAASENEALKEEEEESADDAPEQVASEDEMVPAKPKKKRRPRKVIPVGKNGLKKRRVIKSRQTTDSKGYTG